MLPAFRRSNQLGSGLVALELLVVHDARLDDLAELRREGRGMRDSVRADQVRRHKVVAVHSHKLVTPVRRRRQRDLVSPAVELPLRRDSQVSADGAYSSDGKIGQDFGVISPTDVPVAVLSLRIRLIPSAINEVGHFVSVVRERNVGEYIFQLIGHANVIVVGAAGSADVVELVVLRQNGIIPVVQNHDGFACHEGAAPPRFLGVILIRDLGEDVAGANLGRREPVILEVGPDGGAIAAVRVLLREGVGGDVHVVGVGPLLPGRVSVVVNSAVEALEEVVVDGQAVRADHAMVGHAAIPEVLPVGVFVGGHVVDLAVEHTIEVVVVDLDAVGVVDAYQLSHVGQARSPTDSDDVGVGIRAVNDEVAEADMIDVFQLDRGNIVPSVASRSLVPLFVAGGQERTIDPVNEESLDRLGAVGHFAFHPEIRLVGKIERPVRIVLRIA